MADGSLRTDGGYADRTFGMFGAKSKCQELPTGLESSQGLLNLPHQLLEFLPALIDFL